jgi:beta-phosphoglucomutase
MIDYARFAFIFDMDGTLVDNMRFHRLAWQKLLDENGISMRAEEFLVNTAGKTNREIVPTIFPEATAEEGLKLAERKEVLYRELYGVERRPLPGVEDFLDAARSIGIRLAVATAAPPVNVAFILDGLKLRRYFEVVTNSSEVSHGKPDPEIFLLTAAKLGIEPADCLVFEDALNGFEAAARAGMRSVGLATVNSPATIIEQPSVVAAYRDFLSVEPQDLIGNHILQNAAVRF